LDGELLEETTELFYDIYDLIQGQLYTIGITALYEYLFESNPISLPITFVGSDDILKLNTKLLENYPNPFNPTTTISFTLSADDVGKTKLEIYNLKGQKIRHYSIENNQSSIIWNGTDQTGKQVSSGIYFYRLISDGKHIASKKMLLLK
jgi:flagellar hook assembly protein FlgD